jgi:hypothetical protein
VGTARKRPLGESEALSELLDHPSEPNVFHLPSLAIGS